MRLLICCEFYAPSIGGVQEVIRQISERMVKRGHEVIVATTQLANRTFTELNGVHIEGFSVVGNGARGMKGEIKRYQDFVVNAEVDAILIKAAQQWTFGRYLIG
jgi:glycosyltransferase involved in cell wall biosynthesis